MASPRGHLELEVLRTRTVAALPKAGASARRADGESDRVRLQAKQLAESRAEKLRLSYARAFCAEALTRYWERLRPRPKQSMRAPPAGMTGTALRGEGLVAAEALAGVASALPVDEASYLVGRTYAAMLPDDFRAANGVFYTPPAIVERLLDTVTVTGLDWRNCRVLDPACGGGAFLGPVARRMVRALGGSDQKLIVKSICARLKGYEIDAFSAWMSAVFLDATLNAEIGATDPSFEPIDVGDSLETVAVGEEFDIVVGNPPYGRVVLKPKQRETFSRSLYGHANLYGVFLDLALRKVRRGGVVAYVTPTGFLSGEYFKNLRALLGKEAPPVALDFISQRAGVFDDVLQETLLAVFHSGSDTNAPNVNFVEIGDGGRLEISHAGGVPLPADIRQPWIVPRSASSKDLVTRLKTCSSRLADWGYGVSTGPLVWNRYKDQLRDEAVKGAVPLVWAESVTVDGEFSFRAARRNHAPYFQVTKDDGALLVRRPCVLIQRTTAKEQPRRLIAAELPKSFLDAHGGAVTVENHLNMVIATVDSPKVSPKVVAAFLNSGVADRVFRCISGTVAVSAYELESMPLPPPWVMNGLDDLLSRPHSKDEIESFCVRLYGEK